MISHKKLIFSITLTHFNIILNVINDIIYSQNKPNNGISDIYQSLALLLYSLFSLSFFSFYIFIFLIILTIMSYRLYIPNFSDLYLYPLARVPRSLFNGRG